MRITDYLTEDHRRLEALLEQARLAERFDEDAYARFRAGLLRHIAIEEKVLLPAVKLASGGVALSRARSLRAAHARIAALLAPAPNRRRIAELIVLLAIHDGDEEGEGGVYAECEAALGPIESAALATRAREFPDVRVAPYRDERPGQGEVPR
jgi:hypothetical protein